jgi:hypothetical protein
MSRPERLATLFVGERPDRARFDPPSMDDLRLHGKPKGGLWTCRAIPGRRLSAWEVWCTMNGQGHLLKPGGRWRLVAVAPRILRVDRYDDLLAALERYPYDALPATGSTHLDRWVTLALRGLDWPRIAEEYDAFELTMRGLHQCALEMPGLTAWDVPTVLWLRWCFEEIEERTRCTTSP